MAVVDSIRPTIYPSSSFGQGEHRVPFPNDSRLFSKIQISTGIAIQCDNMGSISMTKIRKYHRVHMILPTFDQNVKASTFQENSGSSSQLRSNSWKKDHQLESLMDH